ncbi:hypothetical protein CPC08DRAFT_727741 [Agrocybe pediades]|nr:hypothetical protein CPC08DRAFT_727741 [Agrocybe pediades]
MLDMLPAPAHQQFSAFHHLEDQHEQKINHGNLYLCQPHTVIELVEVAPPPPRRISSVINSSSAASSSYTSSSSSSSFEEDEEMSEDDEEESVCSSYCSSDFPMEELDATTTKSTTTPAIASSSSDSFMKRILLWREHFECDSSLKRKMEEMDEALVDDSDNESHSSKRSRSHGSSASSSHSSISSEELNMHPCPACDAFFPTLQTLRAHGSRDAPHTNEACCVAVEYAFEH